MTRRRQGIWLSGLLMLSLVGCTTLSPPKPVPPAPTPKVEVSVEPVKPPEAAAPPAPAETKPPEAKPETAVAQAPPAPAPPPAPRPAAPPAPAAAPPRGKFVVLNFDNADIEVVIHAASEIVGFNYVLAPDVRGKVTIQTSSRIPQEEVFNVLLAILEVHGFTAVKSDSLYKIIKVEGARERPVPTIVGTTPDPARVGDEIITQIVPLRFASVADLSNLLRPLISARGNLIPHRETNLLLITDTASNIRRLLDIIKLVDVEVALEELQVVPLKFADAQEIAQILNQIFAPGRRPAAPAVPAALLAPTPGAPPGVPRPTTDGAAAERPPLIVAYRGINVLIVHARKQELEIIRRLLNQLDVDIYGGRRIFIYYAENTKAKDLAGTMNAIYGRGEAAAAGGATGARPGAQPGAPGYVPPAPTPPPPRAPGAPAPPGTAEAGLAEGEVRFIADEVTNSVIVTTFPRNWPDIDETLKKLDRMPRQVLIEVLVAEITLTDETRLGIEWALRSGRFDVFNAPRTPDSTGATALAARPTFPIPSVGTIGGLAQGLNFFTFATNDFLSALNALASDNKVNVLSSPSILTTENKKAVINVSESIPIVTSQQVPLAGVTTTSGTAAPLPIGTQTVEYRDVGVVLTVTPRIGERGTVALDVKQEVNERGTETPPTNSLSFFKREAETSAVLTNNQTLALGGLIKNRRSLSRTGIPLLNRIPLLGLLFGNTKEDIQKTELLILITPRVLGTALDAAKLTEEMKRITPGLRDAIRQSPRPLSTLPPKN